MALASEIAVILAAFVSLCGTIGAISFGSVVAKLEGERISAANKTAETARQKADELEGQNLVLKTQLDRYGAKQEGDEDVLATVKAFADERIVPQNASDRYRFKPFAGRFINVVVDRASREQNDFVTSLARDIVPPLNMHGLIWSKPGFQFKRGVHVFYSSSSRSHELADSVKGLLTEHQIASETVFGSPRANPEFAHLGDDIVLVVGPKP